MRVGATHVHLCVHSQQLGHLFKGSLVFFWSEANSCPHSLPNTQLLPWEGTQAISEDRGRQRGPFCVSRSCSPLSRSYGHTDVCRLCECCLIAKEGSGPGQGTGTPASTVCPGLVPSLGLSCQNLCQGNVQWQIPASQALWGHDVFMRKLKKKKEKKIQLSVLVVKGPSCLTLRPGVRSWHLEATA